MQKFVVVIPSYNNAQWCEQNLSSVVSQDYSDFRVIYTDDCSKDNTAELVEKFIETHDLHDRVKLIKNDVRKGAMHNLYDMIHSCEDNEVIVTVDADDFLAHSQVLSRVNEAYEPGDVWMSYGSYLDYPGMTRGCSKPVSKKVIDSNSYRRHPWAFSHLRTFKAGLFKRLPKSDFQVNGSFMMSGWDCPIMFGLAELSGGKFRYIPDILYHYNNQNPISDYKIRLQEQQGFEKIVRNRKPHTAIV